MLTELGLLQGGSSSDEAINAGNTGGDTISESDFEAVVPSS